MAQALRINPPLESRGMYLFIMSKHYGNQRPSHTGTITKCKAETLQEHVVVPRWFGVQFSSMLTIKGEDSKTQGVVGI
ncbi:hypothetical protein PAMP_023418 [Pampus punctatissimus]